MSKQLEQLINLENKLSTEDWQFIESAVNEKFLRIRAHIYKPNTDFLMQESRILLFLFAKTYSRT